MRAALAALLLLGGAGVVLLAGPEGGGVNGATVLGVLLAGAGVLVHATGAHER